MSIKRRWPLRRPQTEPKSVLRAYLFRKERLFQKRLRKMNDRIEELQKQLQSCRIEDNETETSVEEYQIQPTQNNVEPPDASRLSQLPPEIRLMIFGKLLLCPHPIDLDPLSPDPYENGGLRSKTFNIFRTKLKTHLHPCYVNKAFKTEACGIFYGYNEFRFSTERGWVGAARFLKFAGSNIKFIRYLTIHVPFPGETETEHGVGPPMEEQELNRRMEEESHFSPLRSETEYLLSHGRIDGALAGVYNLRHLNIVMPPHYRIRAAAIPHSVLLKNETSDFTPKTTFKKMTDLECWDVLAKLGETRPQLQISLIKLHKQKNMDNTEKVKRDIAMFVGPRSLRKGDIFNHVPIEEAAKQYGWKVEDMYFNGAGEYPVEDDDEEEKKDV
ncbi:MAG: hypothetical protein M1822_009570 [Bathelium mastoideum]|nr:MAG: hypothetical protein M1822_009570 [Bathelium mastoideum]